MLQLLKGVLPSCTQFAPGDSKMTLCPNVAFALKVMAMPYKSLAFEVFPFLPPPFASEEQQRLHALCLVQALRTYIEQPGFSGCVTRFLSVLLIQLSFRAL